MLKEFIVASIMTCLFANYAVAQEADKNINGSLQPALNYQLIKDHTGEWVLTPMEPSIMRSPIKGSLGYGMVRQEAHGNLLKYSDLDWYVSQSPTGITKAIFAGKFNTEEMKGFKKELENEGTFKKVGFAEALNINFFSTSDSADESPTEIVKAALGKMADEAVDQACSLKARPATISLNAEVNVSLGVGGVIKLGMVWHTKDICG